MCTALSLFVNYVPTLNVPSLYHLNLLHSLPLFYYFSVLYRTVLYRILPYDVRQALSRFACVLSDTGRAERALDQMERALAISPDNSDLIAQVRKEHLTTGHRIVTH